MFKPYRQIEQSDQFDVYEFNTIYLYALCGILAIIAVGYFIELYIISALGVILMVLYFLLVSTQYVKLNRKIKQAAMASSVEMSGSKWSFSNPLQVKIKREFL